MFLPHFSASCKQYYQNGVYLKKWRSVHIYCSKDSYKVSQLCRISVAGECSASFKFLWVINLVACKWACYIIIIIIIIVIIIIIIIIDIMYYNKSCCGMVG